MARARAHTDADVTGSPASTRGITIGGATLDRSGSAPGHDPTNGSSWAAPYFRCPPSDLGLEAARTSMAARSTIHAGAQERRWARFGRGHHRVDGLGTAAGSVMMVLVRPRGEPEEAKGVVEE